MKIYICTFENFTWTVSRSNFFHKNNSPIQHSHEKCIFIEMSLCLRKRVEDRGGEGYVINKNSKIENLLKFFFCVTENSQKDM